MLECLNIELINSFLKNFNSIIEKIEENKKYIIFSENNEIGFLAYSIYYDRIELDYIFINEKYRNKGYASNLLEYLIEEANKFDNITLEVNINNISAINLYKKYGFTIVAKRSKYYGNDDAYLMIRKMM